jgi:DNA-binding transcriptional LysR family regulator
MLDVRRLRIFQVVADEKSISAAAQRLFVTQSAVSQHVTALEREVGAPLLNRTARGVTTTPAGEALLAHTREIFAAIASAEYQMRDFSPGVSEIALGTFSTAAVEFLPLSLVEFKRRLPEVRVNLKMVRGGDGFARLRDGDIEILISWDFNFMPRPIDPRFTQIPLLEDPLRVVLPKDHPMQAEAAVALSDLGHERWVVSTHGPPYAYAYDEMCRLAGFEPDIAFRGGSYQFAQALVAAEMGVTLVPALSLTHNRGDLIIRPLSTPHLARLVSALVLQEALQSKPVSEMLDALRTVARDISKASIAEDR